MKFAQWCAFAALLAAAALLWNLREVLIELFGSIVLAVALSSLVGGLGKRLGWRRWQALLLGLGLVLGLALVLVAVLVPPFVQQFAELIRQLPQAAATLGQLANGSLHRISQMIYGQSELPQGWLQSVTQPSDWGVGRGLGQLLGLAGNLSGGFLHLLFVLAVAVMFSAQPHSYREVAISLMPSFSRRRCRQVLDLCGQALSSWMVGVLISSVCVSLLAFIGLSLLGVKLTMANALLAGLLSPTGEPMETIGGIAALCGDPEPGELCNHPFRNASPTEAVAGSNPGSPGDFYRYFWCGGPAASPAPGRLFTGDFQRTTDP